MFKRLGIGVMACLVSCLHAEENNLLTQPERGVDFVYSPKDDFPTITLSWSERADLIEQIVTYPGFALNRFFCDPREGTLLDYLIQNQLAEDIRTFSQENRQEVTMSIQCDLTPKGVACWPQVLSEILYQLNSIKERDLTIWTEDEALVESLIKQLSNRGKSTEILFATKDKFQFSPSSLQDVIKALFSLPLKIKLECPQTATIDTQDVLVGEEGDMKLVLSRLPKNQSTLAKLDEANRFLPRDTLRFRATVSQMSLKKTPKKVTNSRGQNLFYLDEKCFGTPKTVWRIHFSHPYFVSNQPKEMALAQLWKHLLIQNLKPISREALLALSRVEVQETPTGFSLSLSLWNEVTQLNFKTILECIRAPKTNAKIWGQTKTACLREIDKKSNKPPMEYAKHAIQETIGLVKRLTEEEVRQAVSSVTLKQFQAFLQQEPREASLEGVYIGNQSMKAISSAWEDLGDTFNKCSPTKSFVTIPQSGVTRVLLKLEKQEKIVSSAIYIGESFSFFSHIIAAFLRKEIASWVDQELVLDRTLSRGEVELLEKNGMLFLTITLQSSVLLPSGLEWKLDDILISGLKKFEDKKYFDPSSFDAFKQSFIRKKNELPDCIESWATQTEDLAFLKQENWRFWQNISTSARSLNWSIAKGYVQAVLSPQMARRYIISIE
ncbi:hypothetical protein [Candidatus Similichlamydia laticola]|uniref:Protease III n=1 Tax=Candidatus Similichlamydia laticola TaxID=2170265 RepID=A0A369KHN1_9BACT|nr:hypothetical protein [Candidatus Similichlamydia laticola]RDB31274.1 Protease III precursor [Candidatus Similichlamydia laticola]